VIDNNKLKLTEFNLGEKVVKFDPNSR